MSAPVDLGHTDREQIAADVEALRPPTFMPRGWQDGYVAAREEAARVVRGGR